MSEQRDLVVQRLSDQFAADRLSLEEFERRLDLAYQAQTPAELAALTADLSPLTSVATSPGARHPGLRTGVPEVTREFRSALGSLERSGPMDLPPRVEVSARFANVELDLSEATFLPFTEISISCIFANVEITLPAGVRVENDGRGFLGSFSCHVAPGAMPMVGTAPVVRVTGRVVLGNVEVMSAPALGTET
jgi:hypothetical protein